MQLHHCLSCIKQNLRIVVQRDVNVITRSYMTGSMIGTHDGQEWDGCKGSKPGRRGYTCGLWLLLHSLAAESQPEDTGGAFWMTAVRYCCTSSCRMYQMYCCCASNKNASVLQVGVVSVYTGCKTNLLLAVMSFMRLMCVAEDLYSTSSSVQHVQTILWR